MTCVTAALDLWLKLMRRPPALSTWAEYPVTSVTALLALSLTFLWWRDTDTSWFLMDARAWDGELWRPFTSVFPHINTLHLVVNLYWLWVFGTLVEKTLGRPKYLGILALFAFGSSVAEYAFSEPGVGLSGVGYGLFGLLWVLSRRDKRFEGAVRVQTIQLFVFWFFLCVLLTKAGVWNVGNVAHGVGVLQGVVLGFAMTSPNHHRVYAILSGVIPAMAVIAATVGLPYVNFSTPTGPHLAYLGYLELHAGRPATAKDYFHQALLLDDQQADWWINLAIANQQLGLAEEAESAWKQALQLRPENTKKLQALWKASQAYFVQIKGDHGKAVSLYLEALALDGRDAFSWHNLGISYQHLGRFGEAMKAYQRAVEIDPKTPEFQNAIKGFLEANK